MSRHASVYSSNSAQILGQEKKIWKHFSACCLETIFNHGKDFTQVHGCRVKNLKIADFWKGPQGPSCSSSPDQVAPSPQVKHSQELSINWEWCSHSPSHGEIFGHIWTYFSFQSNLVSNQYLLLLNFFNFNYYNHLCFLPSPCLY